MFVGWKRRKSLEEDWQTLVADWVEGNSEGRKEKFTSVIQVWNFKKSTGETDFESQMMHLVLGMLAVSCQVV